VGFATKTCGLKQLALLQLKTSFLYRNKANRVGLSKLERNKTGIVGVVQQ
jgi:hypothetical protein